MAKAAPKDAQTIKRRRLDKAAQKQIVWQAALELLSEKNYAQTTMAAIAAKAKMSKETLYNLFQSKEALFSDLIENNAKKINELISKALDVPSLPFNLMLQQLSETFLRVLTSEEVISINRVAISSASKESDLASILNRSGRVNTMAKLIVFFKTAIDNKNLKSGGPDHMAEMFVFITLGDLQLRRCLGTYPELSEKEIISRSETAVSTFLQLFNKA